MEENEIIVGTLVGFRYYTDKDSQRSSCLATVETKDHDRQSGFIGDASVFTLPAMLSFKGANAQLEMTFDRVDDEGRNRFKNVTILLK